MTAIGLRKQGRVLGGPTSLKLRRPETPNTAGPSSPCGYERGTKMSALPSAANGRAGRGAWFLVGILIMTNRLLLFVCGCAALAGSPCLRAGETHSGGQAKDPSDCWELTLESGYLWEVGHSTTIPYEIIPTQLVLRGPVMWKWWEGENCAKLIVRNRFATLFEDITVGPEDYYFGVNAAPSVELWSPSRDLSLFASAGGGVGVTNSDTSHHGL